MQATSTMYSRSARPTRIGKPAALASSRKLLKPVHASAARPQQPERKAPGQELRLFLDSANVSQWDQWFSTGLFYGVTTNPTILEKDGVKCSLEALSVLANTAFKYGAEEIQMQAWGDTPDKLHSVALDLAGINPKRVVVKLPCTIEGIQAAAILRRSSIRTTITGVYSAHQAIMAMGIDAEYVAPYLGRMCDAHGRDKGFQEVIQMQRIVSGNHQQVPCTRVLVASIRDPGDIARLAAEGCNTFTMSTAVAAKLFNVSSTIDAAAEFQEAANRNQ